MMKPTPTDTSYETFVRAFLADHPAVQCEWRNISTLLSSRTDVVCGVGQRNEVFASFNRGGQITVGVTREMDHYDVEDFGRGLFDSALAREAFERLVQLLRTEGHLADHAAS
jgi:hypothetical protein